MCTVSWLHSSDGYDLLCNRDEKHTRTTAIPPKVDSRGAVRFIAPIDRDFGGTWLSVNELGVTVCVLNGPTPAALPVNAASRGTLVLDVAAAPSIQAVHACLAAKNLTHFAPFTLVALEPRRPSLICEWTGERLSISENGDAQMPLASSSVDYKEVRRRRTQEFSRRAAGGVRDATLLWDFHRSHGVSPSANSTCMHRRDAATVSFSWVSIHGDDVRFFYTPAAPCQWAPGETVVLPRKKNYTSCKC